MEDSSGESEIAANLVDELLDAQQHDQNSDSESDADELADIADSLLGTTEKTIAAIVMLLLLLMFPIPWNGRNKTHTERMVILWQYSA